MMSKPVVAQSGSYQKSTQPIPQNYSCIDEGFGRILVENEGEVFYNKVQVINRDISSLFIQHHINSIKRSPIEKVRSRKIRICEALSGSGIRSIRYWKEVSGIDEIVTNDLCPDAFKMIQKNVVFNDICPKTQVIPTLGDANKLLRDSQENKFEVIDLDPYGSAVPFIEASLSAISDGGLLCVTCTDLAVLSGAQRDACFARYGSYPIKARYCHEYALRTLLGTLQREASKVKKFILPYACYFIDFYVRVFVQVRVGGKEVARSAKSFGSVFQCCQCPAFGIVPLDANGQRDAKTPREVCLQCDGRVKFGGPVWTAGLHSVDDVRRMKDLLIGVKRGKFSTEHRMAGLLAMAENELQTPLFYDVSDFSRILKVSCPKRTAIMSGIVSAGWQCSGTHVSANAIKTDAPTQVVFDVFRSHVRSLGDGYKIEKKPQTSQNIMKKEITTLNIDLTKTKEVERTFKAFFPKPEKFWGPKSRAKGKKKKKKEKAPKKNDSKKKVTGKKHPRNVTENEGNDMGVNSDEPPTKRQKTEE